MQRYFLKQFPKDEHEVLFEGEDVYHISRVMRMNPGDQVYAVFPNNQAAIVRLENISGTEVTGSIVQWLDEEKELPVDVCIASGLPKGDKLELVIQKGTELGAARFIPFHAARSVVKWDDKKANKKRERWTKIAKEAAEQSHRNRVPDVDMPVSFQKLIEMSNEFTYKIFAFEEVAKKGEAKGFHQVLNKMNEHDKLLIVFGPEGGLSEKEAESMEQSGFIPCGLGPRILRTETAPLYVLSAISYHFELMR